MRAGKLGATLISAWLPVAVWIAVIYLFSDQPYSGVKTERLLGVLNIPIRKLAHVSEFAVLFGLCLRALNLTRPGVRSGGLGRLPHALGAFLLTVANAGLDEWHQAYVPGRSATLSDVAVDTAGAVVALCLWVCISRLSRPREPA